MGLGIESRNWDLGCGLVFGLKIGIVDLYWRLGWRIGLGTEIWDWG